MTKSITTPLRAASLLAIAAFTACEDEPGNPGPIGPGPDDPAEVLVLNSAGQTLASFLVGDELAEDEDPVDLGAAFDGDKVDTSEAFAVSTISSFGGSRMTFVDLETGSVTTTEFPQPEGLDANPSKATFDAAGAAWVAGRGSNAIYTAMPGAPTATRTAASVGTFIEAIRIVDGELAAVDAFLDDDGGTFQPLGASRVFVLSAGGGLVALINLPPEAVNAIDAVVVDDLLVVLLGGTLDPDTFDPQDDGGLVVVDVGGRSATPFFPLDANGVSIEAGADGLVYVTTTSDFVETDLVSFDPVTASFVAGPNSPIDARTAGGADLDCWAATAFEDGRMLCVTFDVVEEGRLYLLDDDGRALDDVASGFGSTDVHVR